MTEPGDDPLILVGNWLTEMGFKYGRHDFFIPGVKRWCYIHDDMIGFRISDGMVSGTLRAENNLIHLCVVTHTARSSSVTVDLHDPSSLDTIKTEILRHGEQLQL
jgi:hypothetical protein